MPNGAKGMMILKALIIGSGGRSAKALARLSSSTFFLYSGSVLYFLTKALRSFTSWHKNKILRNISFLNQKKALASCSSHLIDLHSNTVQNKKLCCNSPFASCLAVSFSAPLAEPCKLLPFPGVSIPVLPCCPCSVHQFSQAGLQDILQDTGRSPCESLSRKKAQTFEK